MTFVSKEFPNRPGTLRFEAMIKSDNVEVGEREYYRGKFQGYIKGNKEYYPEDDFDGTFGWSPRKFYMKDLTQKEVVIFRIGLQNAKGAFYVDEIKCSIS